MNLLERMTIAIRHAPGLDHADWLWSRVRPLYDRALRASYGERGLERVINGTDRILLSPASRGFVATTYEPEVWRRIMREVRSGDVVVEVGASIGIYTLAFAGRVGAQGRVVAFEPDSESSAALRANVAVNGYQTRVTIRDEAVGASAGRASFAAGRGVESRIAISGDARDGSVEVPLVALDDAFAGAGIDILKIDVEGFEQPVLSGARRLLADHARRPRAILIEMHPFAWNAVGTTPGSIPSQLAALGYRVEDMQGRSVAAVDDYGHIVAIAD
jgi:FkbM family methyltransferase